MRKSLFFYSVLLSFLFSQNLNAQVWQPLGDPTGISADNSGRQTLVCDSQDNLIVGYYDVSVAKGSVQKYDWVSGNWSYVGGSAGITTGTTTYNSLSVDSQGNIYFMNQAGWPDSGHEVRKFENDTWTQLPNVTNNGINFNTSAFSPDDVLFAVNNENNGTVKKFIDGGWQQVGTTGFTGGVPYFLDMVVCSNGKIYVSFNNNGYLHVYENSINATTEAWQPVGAIVDLAPAPNTEDYNSSLAIDSQNNLFVAYVSNTAGGNKLNVKKFNGTVWSQLGNENFTAGRAKHTSIAIGANDIVYVAASNWEDDNMLRNYVMAYDEDENIWTQAGTGFASEGQGIFNSLAVDSFGNLFMSYTDSGLEKLMVKRLNLNIVAAASIEITTEGNIPAEISVDNGTLQLNAAVLPAQASQDVVWSIISGETFATIGEDGLVTAIASDAVITVQAHALENTSIFSTIDVVLTNQDSPINAQSIEITTANNNNPEIYGLGETLQLVANTLPIEADQYVTWTVTEGASVVDIDSNGLVTGLTEGFAIIRATHVDGAIFAEIRVDVWEDGCTQGHESLSFGLGYNITNGGIKSTDDFIVPAGISFEITKVRLSVISAANIDLTSFDLHFLKNNSNNQPGVEIAVVNNIVPTSQKFVADLGFELYQYEVELHLPEPVVFNQGTYWLNPVGTAADGSEIYWDVTVYGYIGNDYFINYFDGNGWVPVAQGGFDGVFDIIGNCTPMPIIVKTVEGQDEEILIDETVQLQATVNGTANQNVTWTIEEGNDFVSIDENGLVTGLEVGIARIRATSVENGSFDDIEITVISPNACRQSVPSNNLEEGYTMGSTRLAVDIDVPEGTSFVISSVSPTTINYGENFTFKFYTDDNGYPGEEIASQQGTIVSNTVTGYYDGNNYWGHIYEVKLDEEVALNPGKYWMEMVTDAIGWESSTLNVTGLPGVYNNGSGWTYNVTGSDFVYEINGICGAMLGTTDLIDNSFAYYPNPVKDELNFNSQKKVESIEIFNISGQKVNQLNLNISNGKVSTSELSTGVYIFRATLEGGQIETFKIIKK